MTAYRFDVPPAHALLTLADASGGLSALFAFDAHMAQHLAWLNEAAEGLGYRTEADEEMQDTRAIAAAQTAPIRALRTELAELAADAEAQLPADVAWEADIVSAQPLPPLPDTLGPKELAHVERSFRDGMSKHLHRRLRLARAARRAPARVRRRGVPVARRPHRGVRRLGPRARPGARGARLRRYAAGGGSGGSASHVTTRRAPPWTRKTSPLPPA